EGVSDETLAVEALEQGPAFEELVRRYQNRIYSLAYRMTGDNVEAYDLTQEAFLRCYAALPSFNPNLRFAPWLYRIATNLCINFLQSSRVRKGGADPDLALQMPDRGKQPDSLYEEKEQRQRIHQAILNLPAKYRAVVILRHMQDRTYEEIAAILELPPEFASDVAEQVAPSAHLKVAPARRGLFLQAAICGAILLTCAILLLFVDTPVTDPSPDVLGLIQIFLGAPFDSDTDVIGVL